MTDVSEDGEDGDRRGPAWASMDRTIAQGRPAFVVLSDVYAEWRNDRTMRLGAALAYYGVFAVVPLLVFSIAVTQLLISRADVQAFVSERIEQLLGVEGQDVAVAVASALDRFSTQAGLGILGLVTVLVSASFVVVALEDIFLTIWHVPVQGGMRRAIRRRLTSFVVVVSSSLVLAAIVLVHTIATVLDRVLPDGWAIQSAVQMGTLLVSWAVLAMAIVMLFKFMTPVDVGWRISIYGGMVTAILGTIGAWGLAVYFRYFAGASIAGAAGAVFLVLLWIYYEAQTLLIGMQFIKVLHHRRSDTPLPTTVQAGSAPQASAG